MIVTVHGVLDRPRAAHLGRVLADLIDGQGNLSLLVDLHDAVDAEDVSVFAEAAERARRRGGAMKLSAPPARLHQVLQQRGLGHLVGTLEHHEFESEGTSETAQWERRAPAGRSPSTPIGTSQR